MSDDNIPSHHGIDDQPGGNYLNDTLRLLIERSSCRSFHDRPIPEAVMQQVLSAGVHSPTGGNLQPYSIIQVERHHTKERLNELCGNQPFILRAPVNLVSCIDFHRLRRWAELEKAPFSATASFRHFWISFQDTIIAAQNICTAADAAGLGSVYVGTIVDTIAEVRELLSLPKGVLPVVLLSLGYPKVRPQPKKKLGPEVVVHKEIYTDLTDNELLEAFNNKYPDLKVEITDERLRTIEKVATEVHSDRFARQCIEKIKDQGYINPVQRYFGLHYRADMMRRDTDMFLRLVKEAGFDWFDPGSAMDAD